MRIESMRERGNAFSWAVALSGVMASSVIGCSRYMESVTDISSLRSGSTEGPKIGSNLSELSRRHSVSLSGGYKLTHALSPRDRIASTSTTNAYRLRTLSISPTSATKTGAGGAP